MQNTIEISQLQYTGDGVDVPVVLVVLVPQVQVLAETPEIPQLQVVEKIGEIPEWLNFVRKNFPVKIPRDSAAEQDFACRQEDACEESSRDACRD